MQKQFFGSKNEVLLESDFDIDRLVVFLSGISGKAHSSRFAPLAQAACDVGVGCARLALWEDEEEVKSLSITAIQERITAAFAELEKRDYSEVVLVGKSFGGGMALIFDHPLISRKVLWAPAIGIGEGEGNLAAIRDQELGSFSNLLDIQIGKDQLARHAVPVDIIHGTADEAFSITNSEAIVAALPQGTLHTIDGAGHSFKEPAHERALLDITQNLLK